MTNKIDKTSPGAWTVTASRTIIKDRWIDLRADTCVTPQGVTLSPFYVLSYPEWVHIVCFDGDDRICMVRQYRHGLGKVTLELPGGAIDPGETPLAGAQRELLEETGIRAGGWRGLGAFGANPATHTNRLHVFACRFEAQEATRFDEGEDLVQGFYTLDEIRAAADSGELDHAMHLGAIARAKGWL